MEKSYKELSKGNWGPQADTPTCEELQLGCIQRIADATEIMAKNYIQMQRDLEYYKRECDRLKNRLKAAERSANSYRGHFNRLKKLKP